MRSAAFLLFAAQILLAQPPELGKETAPGPDGQPVMMLRNNSALPVIAWSWEARTTLDRDHFGRGQTRWAGSDGVYSGKPAIEPAAAISTQIRADEPVTLDSAVIYADGTTAGDLKLVERMLDARRAALADIATWRREIESAVANHQPIQTLRERVNSQKFVLPSGGMFAQGPRAVTFLISRTLKDAASFEKVAPVILEDLARMQANLEASKPPLR